MIRGQQPELFKFEANDPHGTVECLGLVFENAAARQTYFTQKLREKLQDPSFRQIEGFPLGSDEDILALSDPPYYTACPNPFFAEFINSQAQTYVPEGDDYHSPPLTVDLSFGKTDPLYGANSYATKVPHQAIMQAVLHYTQPGDVVLDGFAGSGMVGVAAQACARPSAAFKQTIEAEWNAAGMPAPQWGARRAILNDLSPIASFLSASYNFPFEVEAFAEEAQRILEETRLDLGWMYETFDADGQTKGQMIYTVWSELFSCPDCGGEINFFNQALDPKSKQIRDEFVCPHCRAKVTRRRLSRSFETCFDPVLAKSVQRVKRRPVLIRYITNRSRLEKPVDEDDLATLHRVETLSPWPTLPAYEVPIMSLTGQQARIDNLKITHLHHFYLPRTTYILGVLWQKIRAVENLRLRHMLMFWFDSRLARLSVQNRYHPDGHSSVFPNVYFVPPLISEINPFKVFEEAIQNLSRAFSDYRPSWGNVIIGTGDTGQLGPIPNNCIDYIFTDPPVFDYVYYSDVNFMRESWYKVQTNTEAEVVVNKAKELLDYQRLMRRCFEEYYRVLKPNRWITVIFPSARARIWKLIQEAIVAAGFIVAGAYAVDRQKSYKIISTSVRQDLVVSAYKPSYDLEERCQLLGGTPEIVWKFITNHLKQLPICIRSENNLIEVIDERLNYNLLECAKAFLTQRGAVMPLSAPEFYTGLELQFPARDDMYFLGEQVFEYDKRRIKAEGLQPTKPQFVDEAKAIHWLQAQLFREPQTMQEIHANFKGLLLWAEEDQRLDLDNLLAQNFRYYQGRWQLPEPGELQKLASERRTILLEKFQEFRHSKSEIKPSLVEVVRTGFEQALKDNEFKTIIEMTTEIPYQTLMEYPDLMLFYDRAVIQLGS